MDVNGVSGSCLIVSKEKTDCLYPMYFGASCAFFALRLLKGPEKEDEKWSELREKMLQGSAQLLGLLVWRIQREGETEAKCQLLQKLKAAEKEIEELKKRRHEDAKANEKVVGIYASQEQCWLNERRNLRQQIGALINELRVLEKNRDESIAELDKKFQEMELLVQSKDKVIEESEQKRKELEEKLMKYESAAEELRETVKREAQEHSNEIWKHKSAFIELVSNQRRLEAEMGRALRQVEATKLELSSVLEQKEESVSLAQKLSIEMTKMHKDLEQKDKILSAMLRKSKLDSAEKQMLLKEVKVSKAKKKQAELETEMLKAVSGSRNERHSLKSMLASHANTKIDSSLGAKEVSHARKPQSKSTDLVFSFKPLGLKKDPEVFSPLSDCYSPEGIEELVMTDDVKGLEGWVRSEAEKYAAVIEKRHHLELDAFSEQMRMKDEKLEAFRWQLLSMQLESKRLQSYVEGLDQDLSRLRHENMKLEALLLERGEELNSMKEQFASQSKPISQKIKLLSSSLNDPALVTHDAVWSKDKSLKRKPVERGQETKTTSLQISQDTHPEKEEETSSCNQSKNDKLIVQSPEKEFEEEKEESKQCPIQKESVCSVEANNVDKLVSSGQDLCKTSNPLWRMDLQALGVSYKIKRLKQQLLLLERLTGKQESGEYVESSNGGLKDFLLLMSLLNKQVSRYQSLQGKIDDLCKRMQDNNLDSSPGDSSTTRMKGDTKTLEHLLEETFQLQRYMVATGQRLMEIQSKIASGLVGVELDKSTNFDMKRFSDSIRSLFQEVQRGLEVRIARIIGDLEGPLACEGMIHFRR
ncbi:hypothetical protein SLE2022_287420 [Rubroshorea leprosula]